MKIKLDNFFTNINIQQLEGPRSLYSSPRYNNMSIKLDNFGQKITNVALVIADTLSISIWKITSENQHTFNGI
jgi:hypothetical protein